MLYNCQSARPVVDDRQVDVVLPQELKHAAAGMQAADVGRDVQQHHGRVQGLKQQAFREEQLW